jgi:hypothetical protein
MGMYGLLFVNATCILAGPHGMKVANLLSLIRSKLLCTSVGSTSPWITFKIEM